MKKNIYIIGAGVGGVLLALYLHNRSKKTTTTTGTENGGGAGGESKSASEPIAEPIEDTVSDELATKDIKSMEATQDDMLVKEPIMPVKEPVMEKRPLMIKPISIKQTLSKAIQEPIATKELTSEPKIDTSRLSLSRFSGFQGGADYVDVGSALTDLD